MRVAITGANGLLGGEAVAQLAGPLDVLVLGRDPRRVPSGAFAWADADLGDGRSVEAALLAFGAEAVIHAGAVTDMDACERDPALAWRVNVGGTEQVARPVALSAPASSPSRPTTCSTAKRDRTRRRTFRTHAARMLGRSAAARRRRCSSPPPVAIARVAVVYSGRPGAKPTFATQVVEKLSRGEPVKAFSDQYVSTTLAASGGRDVPRTLVETQSRGVLHTSDATVLDRAEFAPRIARGGSASPARSSR